jgi:hypothetical protein
MAKAMKRKRNRNAAGINGVSANGINGHINNGIENWHQ